MKQITNKIYQISLGTVNVFIIDDDGDLTLIDTGMPGSTEKIFAAIKKAGKQPEDIKRLILTHAHTDHAGCAAEIKRRLNIPVLAHSIDAELIEKGISGRQPMHLTPGIINWLVYNLFIKKAGNTIQRVIVDEKLADGDIIPVAGDIQVIHTPGHSAGHMALLVKNEKLLIAADICANAMGISLSTVYEDLDLGIKSIIKAASFNFDKAVFGHGRPVKKYASKKIMKKFAPLIATRF